MSNSSSNGSKSPQNSSSSSESASTDHTPSPPPSPMHPPLPFPIHLLLPQIFILEEVAPFNWSDEEGKDSEEFQLRAEEEAKEAATAAFLKAPTRCRKRRKLGRLSLESSASGLFDSKEANSSYNSSKGFFDGSNLGDAKGGEEEKEDDDDDEEEEEMEYLAPDYP